MFKRFIFISLLFVSLSSFASFDTTPVTNRFKTLEYPFSVTFDFYSIYFPNKITSLKSFFSLSSKSSSVFRCSFYFNSTSNWFAPEFVFDVPFSCSFVSDSPLFNATLLPRGLVFSLSSYDDFSTTIIFLDSCNLVIMYHTNILCKITFDSPLVYDSVSFFSGSDQTHSSMAKSVSIPTGDIITDLNEVVLADKNGTSIFDDQGSEYKYPACPNSPACTSSTCTTCGTVYCSAHSVHTCPKCPAMPVCKNTTCTTCGTVYCATHSTHTCPKCPDMPICVKTICNICNATYCSYHNPNHTCGFVCPDTYYCLKVNCPCGVTYCAVHDYSQHCQTCAPDAIPPCAFESAKHPACTCEGFMFTHFHCLHTFHRAYTLYYPDGTTVYWSGCTHNGIVAWYLEHFEWKFNSDTGLYENPLGGSCGGNDGSGGSTEPDPSNPHSPTNPNNVPTYPMTPPNPDPDNPNPDPDNPDPDNPNPDPDNPNPDPDNPNPDNPFPKPTPDPENPDPVNPYPTTPIPSNPVVVVPNDIGNEVDMGDPGQGWGKPSLLDPSAGFSVVQKIYTPLIPKMPKASDWSGTDDDMHIDCVFTVPYTAQQIEIHWSILDETPLNRALRQIRSWLRLCIGLFFTYLFCSGVLRFLKKA